MLPPRRNVILAILAGVLVILAVATWIGVYWVMQTQTTVVEMVVKPSVTNTVVAEQVEEEVVTKMARQTDGVLVDPSQAKLYPIAVMIENAAFGGVRPQSGLSFAQIVYEVVVEGGITRFMAIYAGDMPEVIGPVRSARPTYLEFASEYDALYAHAGGSPEALQAIDGLAIKSLSALANDSRFFYRDGSKVAPHNLFSSANLLALARRDKGLDTKIAEFDSWVFKDEARPKTKPDVDVWLTIDFGSGPLYVAQYRYTYKTNSYSRWTGDEEQIDAVTGKPFAIKNVIVQVVPAAIPAGDGGRINFNVTGEGKAYIARDGVVVEGTWKKASRTSRTLWYDSTGKEVALNRGATWIAVLPETGTIDYTMITN